MPGIGLGRMGVCSHFVAYVPLMWIHKIDTRETDRLGNQSLQWVATPNVLSLLAAKKEASGTCCFAIVFRLQN
eukprot:scaffold109263_cov15-Tisochrysis_lutea.AAC.1